MGLREASYSTPYLEKSGSFLSQEVIDKASQTAFYDGILPTLSSIYTQEIDIANPGLLTSTIGVLNTYAARLPPEDKIDYKEQNYKQMQAVRDLLFPASVQGHIPPMKITHVPWMKNLSFYDDVLETRISAGGLTLMPSVLRTTILLPDYYSPHAAAHEEAHRLGIKDEADAETVALLAGLKSSDPTTQYFTLRRMVGTLAEAQGLKEKQILGLPLHERVKNQLDTIIAQSDDPKIDESFPSRFLKSMYGNDEEVHEKMRDEYEVVPLQRVLPIVLEMKQ